MSNFSIEKLEQKWVSLPLSLLASLFAVLPLNPLIMTFASRDSGVFLYIGWRILNGEVPYLDIWDHKPPLIYFIDALGLVIFPNSTWGVWLLEWIFLAIAALLSINLLKKFFGFFPALISLYLWLISFFISSAGGNLTTEYTIPFQIAVLYLMVLAFENNQKLIYYFMVGVVGALAFFIRQNSIGTFIAVILYLFIFSIKQKELKKLLGKYLAVAGGFFVVAATIILYFALSSALYDFWDQAFIYNFVYSAERSTTDRFVALWTGFDWLSQTLISPLALIGFLVCIVWLIRQPKLDQVIRALLVTSLIAFPLEQVLVSIGGRPRIPYYLSLLPIYSIFVAFIVWGVSQNIISRFPKFRVNYFWIFILITIATFQLPLYINFTKEFHRRVDSYGVVNYLKNNSNSSDKVLMWGGETVMNFYSKRVSPTRYVYQYALYKEKYADVNKLKEFFNDVIENKPRFIIMATGQNKIPRRFTNNSSDETDALADQIRSMYLRVEKLGIWWVFEYTGSP